MDVTKLPCHICGGTEYDLGQPSYDVFKPLYLFKYAAKITDRMKASFKLHPQDKLILGARRCLKCGNVQLFMDLEM